MEFWLTLFFLLNLVHQYHQLETKSDYQRGLFKSTPESHIKAAVQYGFQIAKWVNVAACSAWLKTAHPGAISEQHSENVPLLLAAVSAVWCACILIVAFNSCHWYPLCLQDFCGLKYLKYTTASVTCWIVLLRLNFFCLSWELFLHWTAAPKNPRQLKQAKLYSSFKNKNKHANLLLLL